MKYLIYLFIIILINGCGNPYPKDDELIIKAYENGFMQGVNMCKRSFGLRVMDTITLDNYSMATWEYDSTAPMKIVLKVPYQKIIVDSIEFRYDSIMVIKYNKNAVIEK